MSDESLSQQIDQEYQGLDYEALLNKADEWLRSGRLNTGYSAEAVRARALLTLNKAIALQPEEAKAYAMKGVMIYEDFIESRYYNYKAYYYTPRDVNKESYMTAYESLYKAWTLQPNKKKHIRNMSFLFNPHFEYYCPGMTSVKQHLTDDQINLLSKFIMDIYTKTELKNAKLSYTQELYKLVSKILLICKNKDLLNLKINLIKLLITYDTQNSPGDYEVDQAASFLDLGEDEKGKLVYQNLLARNPKFPFNANRSILSEPIEGNLHRNMVFLRDFIRVDPNYPYSYYTIGRILEVHFPNETAKAFEYYSKAESLVQDGNFAWKSDCLYRMARLLSIDGKFQQALIDINKAQAIESSSPKIGLEKGRILKSCGQVTLAFFELERAQKLGSAVGTGDEKAKEEATKVNDAILKEKEELLRYFGSKIMQDQVDKVKETLDYDSVAQMKKDMTKIQANQALKDYYDQFVFAFSSLYGTSQVVISGQLSLDTSNTWLDLGAHALSLLPFYGDTIEAIFSTITGQFIGADMKKKAQLFCLLAVNQTQLDNTVSYIARKIVLNPVKSRRIVKLGSSKQEKETVSEFWEKMNKFYAKFKSVTGFKDYNLRSNTPAAKLALKDTATLISRIIKNETLLKKSSEERSDEIVDLFFYLEEETLEKEAEIKANATNFIPVKTASGGFLGCFGGPAKTK